MWKLKSSSKATLEMYFFFNEVGDIWASSSLTFELKNTNPQRLDFFWMDVEGGV